MIFAGEGEFGDGDVDADDLLSMEKLAELGEGRAGAAAVVEDAVGGRSGMDFAAMSRTIFTVVPGVPRLITSATMPRS